MKFLSVPKVWSVRFGSCLSVTPTGDHVKFLSVPKIWSVSDRVFPSLRQAIDTISKTQPSLVYFGASVIRPVEFNNARLVVRNPKAPPNTPRNCNTLTQAPQPQAQTKNPSNPMKHTDTHTHTYIYIYICMRTHTHTLSTRQGPKCQISASWTSSV